jgi:hypothetical protein
MINELAAYNKSVDIINMPSRIRKLPVSPQGFPVPWFVAWFDGETPCETGRGLPDFRVADTRKMMDAIKHHKCWVCGDTTGVYKSFVIGPMCAINKVISEPPSHRDCAIWSARVCPFLSKPKMARNEKGMYDDDGNPTRGLSEASGHAIKRNPGAVCVWTTKTFKPFRPPGGGVLFSLGPPMETMWFAEGRRATRKEVMASIDSGYPTLQELAREEGPEALAALATQRDIAMELVPEQ